MIAYFLNFPLVFLSYFLSGFSLLSISCSVFIPLPDVSPVCEFSIWKGALVRQVQVLMHWLHLLPERTKEPLYLPTPSFTHCSQIDSIYFFSEQLLGMWGFSLSRTFRCPIASFYFFPHRQVMAVGGVFLPTCLTGFMGDTVSPTIFVNIVHEFLPQFF